jgi:DNA recombination protein RmuC
VILSVATDTLTRMTTTMALLLALAAGAVLGGAVVRVLSAGRAAGLVAERELLRERILDLEAATDHDRELAATLSPLAATLQRVEHHVVSLERDRVEQFSRLDEQISAVRSSGEALRVQTAALAGALRSPTARGAWGEVQLRRVVEHAGMVARVDFTTQAVGMTTAGLGVRPDLVVHLPGGKHVVVDAKAPLAAFLEASEETADPRVQRAAAAAHARALRGHVDGLAAKEYWTAFQPTPEIVICFVPGEAFLAAACSADPGLLEYAMSRRVVLATPTTLLALLRTIALTWQSEALTGNARELFEVGRELYARLGNLGGHTARLGRDLQRAVEDYNSMVGTLERRVLVTARRMNELHVTDAELPELPLVDAVPRPVTPREAPDDDAAGPPGDDGEESGAGPPGDDDEAGPPGHDENGDGGVRAVS